MHTDKDKEALTALNYAITHMHALVEPEGDRGGHATPTTHTHTHTPPKKKKKNQ